MQQAQRTTTTAAAAQQHAPQQQPTQYFNGFHTLVCLTFAAIF